MLSSNQQHRAQCLASLGRCLQCCLTCLHIYSGWVSSRHALSTFVFALWSAMTHLICHQQWRSVPEAIKLVGKYRTLACLCFLPLRT